LVVLEYSCVNADSGPAGDVLAADLGTAKGSMPFKKQSVNQTIQNENSVDSGWL